MYARTALFTLAIAAATPAAAEWGSNGSIAIANPSNEVTVGISFDARESCNVAHLFIIGNDEILGVAPVVDSKIFDTRLMDNPMPNIVLSVAEAPLLRALKTGTIAGLSTDKGIIMFTLTGSANALNSAFEGCLQELADSYVRF
jgi:hypothetical protein